MRAVEDEAGLPHGTARHHFGSQRGLLLAMVERLLELDLPRPGETVHDQVTRWLGPELGYTRARYELTVAAFHDSELASMLVTGRDRLIRLLVDDGVPERRAVQAATAIDGLILDAVLRGTPEPWVDLAEVLDGLR